MQTPQTNQTIKQFTPKTNFLFFVKSGLLQYNTTNKGSRPEIQDDPGERREEKRESTIFNTTNKGLCSMSTSNFGRDKISAERRQRRKTKPSGDQEEERQLKATIKGSTLTEIVRILGKRTEVNRRPRCYLELEKLKVLPDFPNLRSESRQYAASKAL